jgi:hypothetical protein
VSKFEVSYDWRGVHHDARRLIGFQAADCAERVLPLFWV